MDVSAIAAALAETPDEGVLPVGTWDPGHCGTMDLVIAENGAWIHEGRQMTRPRMVRLLSRVLRHDPDGYVLVTPAEKLSITVEDVPFIVTSMTRTDGDLHLSTNVGDRFRVDGDHPIEMRVAPQHQQPVAYARVRGDLWARFGRSSFFALVADEAQAMDGTLVVHSGGETFVLGTAS